MRSARSQIIFWSALLLLLLSACGGSPAEQSSTYAGITPTPTFFPTPTPDHDPFQATFIERAPVTTCPPSARPTDLCFNVSGSGTSIPYGAITFTSFDINFLAPGKPPLDYSHDPGYCEPKTRQGSITIGKNTVRFTASGTWCFHLVHFVYQVTGGTGTFRHAHGKGSIDIPNPTSNLREFWTGTLIP